MSESHLMILVADDHPLVRGALKEAVMGLLPHAQVLEAGTFEDVSAHLSREGDLDLILLDLTMPGAQGFSGLMYLRAQYPGTPVIIVSGNEERATIRHAIDFGASGFIPKSVDIEVMRGAMQAVLDGGMWTPADVDLAHPMDHETGEIVKRLGSLTPQQVRVLMMLSEGLLNKQIAYELSVSEATVKAHVSAILQKLGVESRTQAVITASKIAAGQWHPTTE